MKTMKHTGRVAWMFAFVGGLVVTGSGYATLTVTDVGRYDFTDISGSGARELSGLVYAGGATYFAIGDQDALLHSLSISTDPLTGQITSATISPTTQTLRNAAGGTLAGGDREAIAMQGAHLLIANESGPLLEAYDPTTGKQNGPPISPAQPGFGVYNNIRPNKAWESLANFQANTSTFLTANEDALTVDGPAASFTHGAMVRIQAANFDASNSTAAAIGQFAYPIDAINGDNPLVTGETSGLVEMVTMPDNTVLALERAVGLSGYRIRLYQIDGNQATDVSGRTGLDNLTPGVDYTPLSKTLLWENTFSVLSNSNFEGMALRPMPDTDAYSLVLVADNASGPVLPIVGQQWTAEDQSLYALRLAYSTPAPSDLRGDGNGDGFVGLADLDIILSRWNQTVFPGSMADLNVDGYVGLTDLDIVLGNWNTGTPPAISQVIPEPSAAMLLGVIGGWRVLIRARLVHSQSKRSVWGCHIFCPEGQNVFYVRRFAAARSKRGARYRWIENALR